MIPDRAEPRTENDVDRSQCPLRPGQVVLVPFHTPFDPGIAVYDELPELGVLSAPLPAPLPDRELVNTPIDRLYAPALVVQADYFASAPLDSRGAPLTPGPVTSRISPRYPYHVGYETLHPPRLTVVQLFTHRLTATVPADRLLPFHAIEYLHRETSSLIWTPGQLQASIIACKRSLGAQLTELEEEMIATGWIETPPDPIRFEQRIGVALEPMQADSELAVAARHRVYEAWSLAMTMYSFTAPYSTESISVDVVDLEGGEEGEGLGADGTFSGDDNHARSAGHSSVLHRNEIFVIGDTVMYLANNDGEVVAGPKWITISSFSLQPTGAFDVIGSELPAGPMVKVPLRDVMWRTYPVSTGLEHDVLPVMLYYPVPGSQTVFSLGERAINTYVVVSDLIRVHSLLPTSNQSKKHSRTLKRIVEDKDQPINRYRDPIESVDSDPCCISSHVSTQSFWDHLTAFQTAQYAYAAIHGPPFRGL